MVDNEKMQGIDAIKSKALQFRQSVSVGTKFEAKYIGKGNYYSFQSGDKCRCYVEEKSIFVFDKGKRRYGRRLCDTEFFSLFEPKILDAVDENTIWHRQLKSIIKHLKASGLWTNVLAEAESLDKMDYTDFKRMYEYIWDFSRVGKAKDAVIPNWVQDLKRKYPFIVDTTAKTGLAVKLELFSEMYYRPKIKSMYFGSDNAFVKSQIAEALAKKQVYRSGRIRTNYDVSFSYDPQINKAFYSEEYKFCGNGYYYLALDGSTALFCEKD